MILEEDLMISMKNFRLILFYVTVGLSLFTGCGSPTAFFSPEQKEVWLNDAYACKGQRLALISPLEKQLETLKGISEMDIKRIFGKPEKTELHKRSEKFYLYALEPSEKCDSVKYGLNKVLSVRFSAINKVNEIIITQK